MVDMREESLMMMLFSLPSIRGGFFILWRTFYAKLYVSYFRGSVEFHYAFSHSSVFMGLQQFAKSSLMVMPLVCRHSTRTAMQNNKQTDEKGQRQT
jgi:hypothetical protein